MSAGRDVSSILGEYILKGWVLTDTPCPTPGCVVPLLRSRDRSVQFCAKCDGSPEGAAVRNAPGPSTSAPLSHVLGGEVPGEVPDPASSNQSRSSTPISTPPTSPRSLPASLPPLPPPSALTLERRAQSDLASQRIGDLLLQGWAMLAEECPREQCYGVPLVRKPGRGPGGQGECVICRWGADEAPQTRIQAAAGPSRADAPAAVEPGPAPAAAAPAVPAGMAGRSGAPSYTLTHTITALNATLHSLSDRLLALSSTPALVDPLLIKNTVDAMNAVLEMLAKAKAAASAGL